MLSKEEIEKAKEKFNELLEFCKREECTYYQKSIETLLQYTEELEKENNEMAEMICRLDVVNNYKLFNKDVKKVKQYFEKKVKSQMNKEKIEKADKIFEELGYEKTRDGEDCWCVFTKKNEIEVSFEKNIQEVFIEILYDSKEDKEHKAFERIVLLNKKLRKAINLKCEELGFNV